MKSRKLIYAILLFSMFSFVIQSCKSDINLTTKGIKGNGTLTTKEISIDDYDWIEIAGRVELNYQQLEEQAYLQLTIDENLLKYLDICVKNRILYILLVTPPGLNTYNINPTTFIVNTNSKKIKGADLAGSSVINLVSDIQTDILEFDIAGSGKVFSDKTINVGILNIDLAGSATVSLKGNVETCRVDIAGSGNIKSPGLSVKHLRCDVAGSGDIAIDVSESINCDIAGSGTIVYTGNPSSVKQNIAGSGKLIKK